MSETGKRQPATAIAGFTLIEALVVLAIMAIMATLIPPLTEGQRERANVKSAANMLLADLRAARQVAINSRNAATISFAASGDTYLRSYDKKTAVLPSKTFAQLERPSDASTPPTIVFHPDGTTTGGSVHVRSGTIDKTILISWPFGQVSYE